MVMSIDPQGCEDVDDAISIQRLDSGNIEAALWNRNFLTSGTGTVTVKKTGTGTVINYGSGTGPEIKLII
jgi:hypothetical protein